MGVCVCEDVWVAVAFVSEEGERVMPNRISERKGLLLKASSKGRTPSENESFSDGGRQCKERR